MARFLSISSGSNGNCYYIGDERTALIVDAGVGFRTVKSRLAGAGVDIASVEMIFVTHDHVDHIRGLASVAQRLSVPVYATARLHDALSRHKAVGPEIGGSRRVLRPGFETEMRGVRCLAFEVPHDGTDNVGYCIEALGRTIVFMTDLGHVPPEAEPYVARANYLVLEANYDPEMLQNGPYPLYLKGRIAGPKGHLSNMAAAEFLATHFPSALRHVWLCHLSRENNHPELAFKTVELRLREAGIEVGRDVLLTPLKRTTPSELYELD